MVYLGMNSIEHDILTAHNNLITEKEVFVALKHSGCCMHWTEVISSHHPIFAPVQKVKIALTKFIFYEKVKCFVETQQIMSFQNDG